MPGGLLCSPRISSWHDVSGGSRTGAIWDMMIKVTVFKLVETGGVKSFSSENVL